MQQRRVIVSVTNDLVTDQRVHRSCMALCEAGCSVTLVGRRLPCSNVLQRPYKTTRMALIFRKKALFYAEYNLRLFFKLLFSRADIFYANDTDTLLANYMAARIRRKPLFFDAHEMFPEVPELVGRDLVRRIWTKIEDRVFPRIAKRPNMAAVTVCQSIADIYRQRYGLKMDVVRNVPMPSAQSHADVADLLANVPAGKRILLYQGAVNIGRGIEWMMEAMPYLNDCHFLVAGDGDIFNTLKQRYKNLDNVTLLGRVEPQRLKALTLHADLGISLLENRGLNYYYSLPNRLADFVQAEVPVLATDFPEIHRVVATYTIGTLVAPQPFNAATRISEPPDPRQLADTVRATLAQWDTVDSQQRKEIFARAAADLTWENDKQVLINSINTIFQND